MYFSQSKSTNMPGNLSIVEKISHKPNCHTWEISGFYDGFFISAIYDFKICTKLNEGILAESFNNNNNFVAIVNTN